MDRSCASLWSTSLPILVKYRRWVDIESYAILTDLKRACSALTMSCHVLLREWSTSSLFALGSLNLYLARFRRWLNPLVGSTCKFPAGYSLAQVGSLNVVKWLTVLWLLVILSNGTKTLGEAVFIYVILVVEWRVRHSCNPLWWLCVVIIKESRWVFSQLVCLRAKRTGCVLLRWVAFILVN